MTTFTKAIVRPPAPNFSEGLTTAGLGAPNYDLAQAQHQAYCAALEQCGLTLTTLEPDANHPDSTFVEDTAIVTERCAVLARPGAPSRAGEVASLFRVLSDLFPSLHTIEAPGTLDGGDVCRVDDHFFIGISRRTNEAGALQLAQLLAPFGYTSSFVDIAGEMKSEPEADGDSRSPRGVVVATGSLLNILHLKSAIAYLGDNRLVVTEALAGRPEFQGYELVPVSENEAYAANCVRVNDRVLLAAGNPAFAGKLRALGDKTITLEMSEFQKMDGGLSCLSLRF